MHVYSTVGVFIQKLKEQNMVIYKKFVVGRFSFLALDCLCLIQKLIDEVSFLARSAISAPPLILYIIYISICIWLSIYIYIYIYFPF